MIEKIVIGLLLLVIGYLIYRQNQIQKNSDHLSKSMDQHILEVQSIYAQMRGIRHDYKNQIQVMKAYRQLNQDAELDRYLNQMDHELNQVDTIIYTGNISVDAIVNTKLTLAKNLGIELNAKAIVPQELPYETLDLGILIGNLLNNAIENAKEADNPMIRLYIAPIKNNLYISCTNSMKQKKLSNFITTKVGTEHGFGLKRMDMIIHKYNGWVNRASEDYVFVSEINLPLMPQN